MFKVIKVIKARLLKAREKKQILQKQNACYNEMEKQNEAALGMCKGHYYHTSSCIFPHGECYRCPYFVDFSEPKYKELKEALKESEN